MSFAEEVWIVDDDSSIRWVMEKALTRAGLSCRVFESADEVLGAMASVEPMVVISDIRMPGMDGICLLYTSPSPRDLSTSRMPSSA